MIERTNVVAVHHAPDETGCHAHGPWRRTLQLIFRGQRHMSSRGGRDPVANQGRVDTGLRRYDDCNLRGAYGKEVREVLNKWPIVIPAQAGSIVINAKMDPRRRGDDLFRGSLAAIEQDLDPLFQARDIIA